MRFILGPELIWLIFYVVGSLIARANAAPTRPMDNFIEVSWFWIPLISASVFALWYVPSVEKNWLLLRVWILGIVAGHFTLEKVLEANSTQGPGIGMGYLAGMMLIFALLVVGTIFVKIRF